MKKSVSIGIGLTLVLSAAPLMALAHESGEPHPHPALGAASTTRPALPKPIRAEIKDKLEQKHLMNGASSTRPMLNGEMKEKRAELKDALEVRREKFDDEGKKRLEGLKKKFGEAKSARIEEYFKKMVEKFEAAIERQQNYADKIGEFIDKAEANGKDVTELRAKLVVANEALLAALSALEDAKTKYAEAAANSDFTARFAAVRTLIEGVAEKVRASHQALTDVIKVIKGLGRGRGTDHATTTAS